MTKTTQPKFSPGDLVRIQVTGEVAMVLREDRTFHYEVTNEAGRPEKKFGYLCRVQNLDMVSFLEFELASPFNPEEKEHLSI